VENMGLCTHKTNYKTMNQLHGTGSNNTEHMALAGSHETGT